MDLSQWKDIPLCFYLPVQHGARFALRITRASNPITVLCLCWGPSGQSTIATCFAQCLKRLSCFESHQAMQHPSETLQWSKLNVAVWSSLSSCSSCCVHTPKQEWRVDSCVFFLIIVPPLHSFCQTVVISNFTVSICFSITHTFYEIQIIFRI